MLDIDAIRSLVVAELDNHGAVLFDLEVKGRTGRFRLCVTADKEGGISVADCALVSRHLAARPELTSLLGEDFEREVSSPGVARPLTTESEFRTKVGRLLDISFNVNDEKKSVKGKLLAVNQEGVVIELNGRHQFVQFAQILKAVQALPW